MTQRLRRSPHGRGSDTDINGLEVEHIERVAQDVVDQIVLSPDQIRWHFDRIFAPCGAILVLVTRSQRSISIQDDYRCASS